MASKTKKLKTTSSQTGTPGEAYLDTSSFIAFLDRSDSYHLIFKRLFAEPPSLVTSSLVIAEGHGWFLRRYDRNRATQFLAFIEEIPTLMVEPFDPGDLAKCRAMTGKFGDQDLTLADVHGLVIMAEHGIKSCWSTDRHLTLTGIKLVIATGASVH